MPIYFKKERGGGSGRSQHQLLLLIKKKRVGKKINKQHAPSLASLEYSCWWLYPPSST